MSQQPIEDLKYLEDVLNNIENHPIVRTPQERINTNTWDHIFGESLKNPSELVKVLKEFGSFSPVEEKYIPRVLSYFDHLRRDRGNLTVVDMACGMGRLSNRLLIQGHNVKAFDLSPNAIQGIGYVIPHWNDWIDKGKLEINNFDMFEEWPESYTNVDVVLGLQALYHGTRGDVEKGLKYIHDYVLKPGGMIGFSASRDRLRPITGKATGKDQDIENLENTNQVEILSDGSVVPLTGRERGLPHFYFESMNHIEEVVKTIGGYESVDIFDLNGQNYWFVWGTKRNDV